MSVDRRMRMTVASNNSVSIIVFMRVVSLSRASVGGRGCRELSQIVRFCGPARETQDHQGICLYGRAAGGALKRGRNTSQQAIKAKPGVRDTFPNPIETASSDGFLGDRGAQSICRIRRKVRPQIRLYCVCATRSTGSGAPERSPFVRRGAWLEPPSRRSLRSCRPPR